MERLGDYHSLVKQDPLKALSRLPFLTKQIIRDNFELLKSRDLQSRRWFYNTSGGSTGEPVRFIQDEVYHVYCQSLKRHYDRWTGYEVGMPKVVLWGSERDLLLGKETLRTRVGRWLRNELWLNAFRMSEEDLDQYVAIINKVKPVQILAYAQAIYELARHVEEKKLVIWSPRAIMTTAGTLHVHMREVIERVFGAPVFNRYGSREVGDIACECEAHEGLHICPFTHYVEIVREDGTPAEPGEVGEVVVTSLINYAMPLIRYRIGDMAAWADEKCRCGRAWPLLKEVTGRVTDMFVSASGTRVHGEYFTHLLYFRDWVKKFQFVQESHTHILLRVVPAVSLEQAKRIAEQEHAELEDKVRLVMGPACKLEIEFVDDIPPSSSGKYRYTISKVHT